ncbi:MAG: CvpA family protein [Bacillota bacterium]
MTWLDILLLIIFLLHLVSGFVRGLVKQLFDIFGFFLIIIASLWGSKRFSYLLADYVNPEDIIPHHEVIESLGVELALETVPQLIAGVLTFLILFLILSLVFRLFSGGFKWVNRIPVIGFFNRIGGGVLGAVVGVVFVYIIIAALSLVPLQFFMNALDNSEIVFITDHYLTPIAKDIGEIFLNYYVNLNS